MGDSKKIDFEEGGNYRDIKVFEHLFSQHFNVLTNFCAYFVNDFGVAEDIVQESFVELWNRPESLPTIQNVRIYLYKQVKNKALNHIRHLGVIDKYNRWAVEAMAYAEVPDSSFNDDPAIFDKITSLIDSLPAQMKKVFTLCVIDGVKYEDASKTLGISKNTINTHIKRAYKIIRKQLDISEFYILAIILKSMF